MDGFSPQILQAHLRPASFLILLFRHPHLLEAAQGGQNWATWVLIIKDSWERCKNLILWLGGSFLAHLCEIFECDPLTAVWASNKEEESSVKGILCFNLTYPWSISAFLGPVGSNQLEPHSGGSLDSEITVKPVIETLQGQHYQRLWKCLEEWVNIKPLYLS